jgi:hypothetical protein
MGTTAIEREPFIRAGTAEAAVLRFRFKNGDLVAPFMEEPGKGEAGQTSTQNGNLHAQPVGVQNLYWCGLVQTGTGMGVSGERHSPSLQSRPAGQSLLQVPQ